MKLLLDSDFVISYLDRGEANHPIAREWLADRRSQGPCTLLVCDHVIDEVLAFITARRWPKRGRDKALRFLGLLSRKGDRSLARLVMTDEKAFRRALEIFVAEAHGRLSLTDCILLVHLRSSKGTTLATFDQELSKRANS